VRLEHDGHGFDLTFEAIGPPAEVPEAIARAGGMGGHEQPCAVHGTVRTGGRVHRVRCLGQRGHARGEADWDHIERVRIIAAWPEDAPALAVTAIRREGVREHGAEAVWAVLMGEHDAVEVDQLRLTTTYDADDRQRRAGLELWVGENDDFPHSGFGTVLCGSTLELGQLRLDCAFFRWQLDGSAGVGRYDTLRKVG
jgi:hypothetical protein